MKLPRRRVLHLAAGAAALPALSHIAWAQSYPSRPITMIVPFAAGGPTDTIGRTVAEGMRAKLGQPVILENVTGAAGSIGLGRVARAPADGYTINVGNWSAHVVNGAIYALPYDLLNDFEPIALLAQAPQLIVARKATPADDLKGLIGWLKANPDKATLGTAGVGSPPHLGGIFFQTMTGTRAQLVSYRGAAPAMQDLVAGQIDMMISDTTTALPQVRAGTIKAYAVAARSRLPAAPDLPTADEAGLKGFEIGVWHGLYAPAGTAAAPMQKLVRALQAALKNPELGKRFADINTEPIGEGNATPEALRAKLLSEIDRWAPIIKEAGQYAD